MQNKLIIFTFTVILILLVSLSPVLSEDGVTDKYIQFGQTVALTGLSSEIGIGMRDGVQVAFEEINREGGVHGRLLKLVTMDDGYEPERVIVNMNKLINEEKVFSIIGPMGTPTSYASAPIACKKKVPFIGPFTGADFLREMDCVVNLRGTYCQEVEMWIKHLTEDLGIKRVALLYQDDAGGRVGQSCANASLGKRGLYLVGEGTYKRNTMAVKGAVIKIKRSNPEAIITFATYKPLALFIKTARKVGLDVPIMNFSFTTGEAFIKALDGNTDNVVVSQVVPSPFDVSIPITREYQEAIQRSYYAVEPGFISIEGYMVGRLAIIALEKAGRNLTREKFLNAFSGEHDLGGIKMTYDMPEDNQGMDDIFLTVTKPDGSFEPIKSLKALKRTNKAKNK